jgi:ATP-binding cassette subfamily B protein RaxB
VVARTDLQDSQRTGRRVRELSERLSLRRRSVPVLLQGDVAECGLACLAMVAAFHGHRIDLPSLRRKLPPSVRGVTLRSLIASAAALHLGGRALRLELDRLGELRTPCVLHWDLVHFVVLVRVQGDRIVVHDPAVGRRIYSLAEASAHFTGVALELTPTAVFQPGRDVRPLRMQDLWSKVQGMIGSFGMVLALSIVLQLAILAGPFYTQFVVDHVLARDDRDLLFVLALGFGFVLLFRTLAALLRDYAILFTSQLLSFQMSTNLISHLIRLPLSYFEGRHLGDVLSRVRSLAPIENLLTTGFVGAVLDGVMALGVVTLMLVYSPRLTLVVLAAALLLGAVRMALYRPVRQIREEGLVAAAQEESATIETLRGMQAVKLLGIESLRDALWQNRRADTMNASVRVARWDLGFSAASTLLFGLENLLVIYWAAQLVLAQQMSIGMLYAFLSYKMQLVERMNSLIDWVVKFRMLDVHLTRLADVVHTPEEAGLRAPDALHTELAGRIELRNVSFRYAETEPWILRDVSLTLEAGACACLIGRSGGGKTTLLKILLGILQPSEGEVLVDGRPLAGTSLGAYRRQIGSVMQEDHFFEGTIAENISAFDPGEEHARIERAARAAFIHDDVSAMPMGYQSWSGNMGASLSGGQRQRILLARALYRDPRLLVLDEGTANLDPALVQMIAAAVGRLEITRIIATHQHSMLPIAQAVFLVDRGTVTAVERPTRAGSSALLPLRVSSEAVAATSASNG